ncbi:MAG: hypothetical protein AB7E72_06935 [Lysobacterales bacterium]
MMTIAGTAAEQAAPAEPSADLLLYLGEFEDARGEFVDPMTLEDSAAPDPARQTQSETDGNDGKDHGR